MQMIKSWIKPSYASRLFVAFVMLILAGMSASAHEIKPAIADFKLEGADRFRIVIQTNLEAMMAKIGPEHDDTDDSPNASRYNELRELPPAKLEQDFLENLPQHLDGVIVTLGGERIQFGKEDVTVNIPPVGDLELPRDSVITLNGDVPEGASSFNWRWPAEYGPSVIRLDEPGKNRDEGYTAYLTNGAESESISLVDAQPPGFWKTAVDYLVIGFTHIVPKGLDHILFVIGLFLLSTRLAPLLWQVTAFTLAHTVTLALGVLGYVSISPAIVEPLIAASIAYVAIENIMTDKLHKWRPAIVFLFGLLHGLGFAGVLGEIGLSQGNFVTGLVAFNIGVELGQLAVIAGCFLAVGLWFGQKSWYRQMISIPASLCIAIIALWWTYERVFLA